MYAPAGFRVTDADEIAAMLARPRLAMLVTQGPEGLAASHLPLLYEPERNRFVGHLARANPHRETAHLGEALVVIPGADAYVSPAWYPSKAEHGRVVPTWNYEAVHVHGALSWFDDPERLLDLVRRLSDAMEENRPTPWSVDDAPADYVQSLIRAIVGVEIGIGRVEATRKLSQNRTDSDRAGVISGLQAGSALEQAVAAEMRKPEPT